MATWTRVRFADGTEEVMGPWREPDFWLDGTPKVSAPLAIAVELAEWDRKAPHAGAWLEFAPAAR